MNSEYGDLSFRVKYKNLLQYPPSYIKLYTLPTQNLQIDSGSNDSIIFGTSLLALTDIFDDGLPAPAQAYLKVCSAMSEASLNDVKSGGPHAILACQDQEGLPSSPGTTVQRRSVVRTEEIVSLNFHSSAIGIRCLSINFRMVSL